MIKVNYNDNGTVYAFGLDRKPFIEISEEELINVPDRYSYYAVVDGKLTIKRRTPTDEEVKADEATEINRQIRGLKQKLFDTDYKAIKYSEGLLTDEEYAEVKAQRQEWRTEINKLEERLK